MSPFDFKLSPFPECCDFFRGNSPAYDFLYADVSENTVPSSEVGRYEESLHTYPPMKMEQTDSYETSAYRIQRPGNYPA